MSKAGNIVYGQRRINRDCRKEVSGCKPAANRLRTPLLLFVIMPCTVSLNIIIYLRTNLCHKYCIKILWPRFWHSLEPYYWSVSTYSAWSTTKTGGLASWSRVRIFPKVYWVRLPGSQPDDSPISSDGKLLMTNQWGLRLLITTSWLRQSCPLTEWAR